MEGNPLSASVIESTARQVAQLVRDNYVFADNAATIAALVTDRATSGAYAVAELPELAQALTADLQSVNGDRHLRVLFTDEPLVDLADPEAELAMWSTRADRDAGGMAKVELLAGGVGLLVIRPMLYPALLAGERISAAMTLLAESAALILDLRHCVGGSPDSVALLCSYLFDDDPVHLNSMAFRDDARIEQSWTQAWVPGRRFGGSKPIVVLTSSATFSGGEELAYDLQQLGRARIVGEQTGGGANPRQGHRVHPNLELTVPVARPINPVSGTNWELVGVTPDVPTPSDQALETALGILNP